MNDILKTLSEWKSFPGVVALAIICVGIVVCIVLISLVILKCSIIITRDENNKINIQSKPKDKD